MSDSLMQVELVSADQLVWSGQAKMVVARTTEGDVGILPNHAPMLSLMVDGIVDVSGGLVFTVAAGFLLGSANALGAAVLLIPLAGVVLTSKALDGRIKRYRADDRAATAAVTGLVGA